MRNHEAEQSSASHNSSNSFELEALASFDGGVNLDPVQPIENAPASFTAGNRKAERKLCDSPASSNKRPPPLEWVDMTQEVRDKAQGAGPPIKHGPQQIKCDERGCNKYFYSEKRFYYHMRAHQMGEIWPADWTEGEGETEDVEMEGQ